MATNPLVSHPHDCIIMPMKLFPSVNTYALMARYGTVIIDDTARYDKRHKEAHRYDIADVTGPLSLTVPVAKPGNSSHGLTWHDIPLSRHGNWWHVHRVTLESAYGRTPFFEFYIDRLARFCAPSTPDDYASVADLCRDAYNAVAAILGLENTILFKSRLSDGIPAPPTVTSLAPSAIPQSAISQEASGIPQSPISQEASRIPQSPISQEASGDPQSIAHYYQVRASRHGFIPNLSILDLIFNLGPESPLHLLPATF